MLQGKAIEEASADHASKKTPARERKIIRLSLQETFGKRKLWDISDARANETDKKSLLVMALDNQPFSMAADDGFISLMAHLLPQYIIPSRKFFVENVLPDLYEKVRKNVAVEVAKADHVSFIYDIWICPSSPEAFMSLSAHWIDAEYVRRNTILHASHFDGSHIAVNISDKLTNMWGTRNFGP